MLNQTISKLTNNPKQIFLIDGIGAIVSATFLGLILPRLGELIKLPNHVLYMLAACAVGFALYSLFCYFNLPKKWPLYLKGIATINLTYAIATFICLLFYLEMITILDWVYFIGEILILVLLVRIEFSIANKKVA